MEQLAILYSKSKVHEGGDRATPHLLLACSEGRVSLGRTISPFCIVSRTRWRRAARAHNLSSCAPTALCRFAPTPSRPVPLRVAPCHAGHPMPWRAGTVSCRAASHQCQVASCQRSAWTDAVLLCTSIIHAGAARVCVPATDCRTVLSGPGTLGARTHPDLGLCRVLRRSSARWHRGRHNGALSNGMAQYLPKWFMKLSGLAWRPMGLNGYSFSAKNLQNYDLYPLET